MKWLVIIRGVVAAVGLGVGLLSSGLAALPFTVACIPGALYVGFLARRKIGGITGWLRAMALAEAASLPLSSHLFIEASAHALSLSPTCHYLEYLDMAGAILAEPVRPVGGMITARGPGLGMAWEENALARCVVG